MDIDTYVFLSYGVHKLYPRGGGGDATKAKEFPTFPELAVYRKYHRARAICASADFGCIRLLGRSENGQCFGL